MEMSLHKEPLKWLLLIGWQFGGFMDNTSHNKKTLSIIPPSLDMFDHLAGGLLCTIWWRVAPEILSYNNYNERITSISLRIVRGRAQSRVAWHCDAASWRVTIVTRLTSVHQMAVTQHRPRVNVFIIETRLRQMHISKQAAAHRENMSYQLWRGWILLIPALAFVFQSGW